MRSWLGLCLKGPGGATALSVCLCSALAPARAPLVGADHSFLLLFVYVSGPKLGREVLETMVNNSLAVPAVTNAADAEFKGACKGLLVACERWSLLSECSHVLQLLSKAGIEIPLVFHGRLIDAGAEARRERANRGGACAKP